MRAATPAGRLAAVGCVLLAVAGCAGAPAPTEPSPEPRPAPTEGRELSSPVEGEEAESLEAETREAIREAEALLDGLGTDAREARSEAVARIQGLLDQSRTAYSEGDLERAHNLARKARELAADL